jgi:hypothetical protein
VGIPRLLGHRYVQAAFETISLEQNPHIDLGHQVSGISTFGVNLELGNRYCIHDKIIYKNRSVCPVRAGLKSAFNGKFLPPGEHTILSGEGTEMLTWMPVSIQVSICILVSIRFL